MKILCFLQLLSVEEPWTLILDDALANSFVAPVTDNISEDHQLTCKSFSLEMLKIQKRLQIICKSEMTFRHSEYSK